MFFLFFFIFFKKIKTNRKKVLVSLKKMSTQNPFAGKILIRIIETQRKIDLFEILDDQEYRMIQDKYSFFIIDPLKNIKIFIYDHINNIISDRNEILKFINENRTSIKIKCIHNALKTTESKRFHGIGSDDEEDEEEELEITSSEDTRERIINEDTIWFSD